VGELAQSSRGRQKGERGPGTMTRHSAASPYAALPTAGQPSALSLSLSLGPQGAGAAHRASRAGFRAAEGTSFQADVRAGEGEGAGEGVEGGEGGSGGGPYLPLNLLRRLLQYCTPGVLHLSGRGQCPFIRPPSALVLRCVCPSPCATSKGSLRPKPGS